MGPGVNPCCGVKLKAAVVVIAVVDIIYGCLFLTFGIITIAAGSTPKALREGLEAVNLIGRPVFKIIAGIVLLLSALFHIKRGGIPSIGGCIVWIIVQLALFFLTIVRFSMYMKYLQTTNKDLPQYYLRRSGHSTLEVLAVMTSIMPFASVFVLWYEIVCVGFFAFKIIRDRTLLEEVEKTLKDVETQYIKIAGERDSDADEDEAHRGQSGKRKVKSVLSDPSVSSVKHKTNKRKDKLQL